jgi:hypothetical protein
MHTGALDQLPSLRCLALQYNLIMAVPDNIFKQLPSDTMIELFGNPLMCVPSTNNKELDVYMKPNTSLRGCEQIPWILGTSMLRFAFTECNETRSWEQISDIYNSTPEMLTVGGLGTLTTDIFEVWTCFAGHDCLQRVVDASYTDAMCHVFDEELQKWYPWALDSERATLTCK